MERDPIVSVPDLEAEERATYYTARSVPVDSAALYEAVNAYVHLIAVDHWNMPAIDAAHKRVMAVAYALAQSRYEQRHAQQTEAGK